MTFATFYQLPTRHILHNDVSVLFQSSLPICIYNTLCLFTTLDAVYFSISCSKSTNKNFHLTLHFLGTLSDGLWTFSYDFIFLAHYFWLESSLHAFQTDFLRISISVGSYIRVRRICVQVNRGGRNKILPLTLPLTYIAEIAGSSLQ